MKRGGALVSGIALGLALAGAAATDQGPLVVAIDTSRSLTPRQLGEARSLLDGALGAATGDGAWGLLAFDDQPRWVVPLGATREQVRAALPDLTPRGDHTLLNDALFVAIRALGEGGAILLVTDGRDENSATTVEDVAAAAEQRGVRIVALGLGGRVEERALRRLALLSDGRYVGRMEESSPAALAAVLAEVRSLPREASAPATTGQAPTIAPPPPGAESLETGAPERPLAPPVARPTAWLWWAGAIVVLMVAGLLVLVVTRSRARTLKPARRAYCPRCGSELAVAGAACTHCEGVALQARLRDREVARLEDTAQIELEAALLDSGEESVDRLEKTRVLLDQSLLVVREPGEPPRSYVLHMQQAFSIGRDPKDNTLALRDPTLSLRHFMVVPEEGVYYAVDLGSTNGTFLDRERIAAAPLATGDVVRAGQSEFEYRRYP